VTVRARDQQMQQLTGANHMPINWADIPWPVIGLLAALTFVTSLVGHSLTRNAFVGAIITVILFVAIYIFWDFYPHGLAPGIRFPTKL
jgi:hypothetical protein